MSEKNKALARRFYEEVLSKKNLDAIDELCDPEIVDHNPLPGQAPGLQGLRQTIAEYVRAFPDMRVTVREIVAEGDVVAVRLTGEATHSGSILGAAATGKKVTIRAIDMIRVKNGKATEVWHEGNDVEVLGQIGVKIPVTT
jgi:predicted ester cyclase